MWGFTRKSGPDLTLLYLETTDRPPGMKAYDTTFSSKIKQGIA
jgi:hypothetical protein